MLRKHYELWLRSVELFYSEPQDGEACQQADRDERTAMEHLLGIAPMTFRGLRTTIAYLVEFDRGSIPETSGAYMETLLRSPVLCG